MHNSLEICLACTISKPCPGPCTQGGKQAKPKRMPLDDCLSSGNTDGPLITAVPLMVQLNPWLRLVNTEMTELQRAVRSFLFVQVSKPPGCALTAIPPASTRGHLPFPHPCPTAWDNSANTKVHQNIRLDTVATPSSPQVDHIILHVKSSFGSCFCWEILSN